MTRTAYLPPHLRSGGHASPFDLDDHGAYSAWREAKLAARPASPDALLVEVRNLEQPTPAERHALLDRLRSANMVLYRCNLTLNRGLLLRFGIALGLEHLDRNPAAGRDGLSAIRVDEGPRTGEFIPYTDRALSWHTDGYYNSAPQRIRAFLLHCARPAAEGGVNRLFDPELAYIALRDRDPALVAALMHPRAMTVPAREVQGRVVRPAVDGPVFAVDAQTGALIMRYTARTRSIAWRDDAGTRAAIAALRELLEGAPDGMITHRLDEGQGLVCNNVLHSRSAFRDIDGDRGRLLYRARFMDRVPGT